MGVIRRWLDRQHAAEIADLEEAVAFYKDWVDEQRGQISDLDRDHDYLLKRHDRFSAYLSDIASVADDLDEAKRYAAEALAEDARAAVKVKA